MDVQSQLAMQHVRVCEMQLVVSVMPSEEPVPSPAAAHTAAVDEIA